MSPEAPESREPSASLLESTGLDIIAESEREGWPRDLFMPWFAANISVLGLPWGAWVLGFGLSLAQAVIAAAVGVAVSFGLCGVIAILGKRGSAPTLALSRAAFGYNGNRVSAAISWMLTVGWETVLCVLATLASATVLRAMGWEGRTSAQIIGFLLTVGLAASAGILGFEAIMRVQTWITWATGTLTAVYLILVADHIDPAALAALPAAGTGRVEQSERAGQSERVGRAHGLASRRPRPPGTDRVRRPCWCGPGPGGRPPDRPAHLRAAPRPAGRPGLGQCRRPAAVGCSPGRPAPVGPAGGQGSGRPVVARGIEAVLAALQGRRRRARPAPAPGGGRPHRACAAALRG